MNEKDKDEFKKKVDKEIQPTSPQLKLHLPISNFETDNFEELASASNLYHLVDSFPLYSTTKREMANLRRKEGAILPFLRKEFSIYSKRSVESVQFSMVPAIIEETIKGKKVRSSHYPSAEEQLVEQALRKILFSQRNNKLFNDKVLVVYFTIDEIEKELKELNRERNHNEIIKSLDILSGTFISLEYGKHGFYKEPILTYGKHPATGKYYAKFARIIEQSIRTLDYRQFNVRLTYGKKNLTQLASWITSQLFLNYKNAATTNSFKITLTEIRESSLLLKATEIKQQVRTLRHALSQITAEEPGKAKEDMNRLLKSTSNPSYTDAALNSYELKKIAGEWVLEMFPSDFFIDQMIKANVQRKKLTGGKKDDQ